jgi:tRNA modification GTPase
MNSALDPIAAMATAPGRGGIGVIRVSAPSLGALITRVCARPLVPRQASLVCWRDAMGEPIDEGIALWFAEPHSYTGEDVLELQGHGGPVVLARLLERLLELGRQTPGLAAMRLAEPGEFTRRAFLNGQLDLAQAEAVADLIDASTQAGARAAMRSLQGRFSGQVKALVAALVELRALVEATIDFPEEDDVDTLAQWDAQGRLQRIRADLAVLREGARVGLRLRDGLTVVLAGAPNVGKSSLLNALAGRDLAIVSPLAGTTRDRIEHCYELDGMPLTLIDTAGLRQSTDPIERIGIERTLEAIERADLVLHLVDSPCMPATSQVQGVAAPSQAESVNDFLAVHRANGVPVLRVRNKIDRDGLLPRRDDTPLEDASAGEVLISAKTRDGFALLLERLRELAGLSTTEPEFIARERHLQALIVAGEHLQCADQLARPPHPQLELFAEELRLAQEQLGTITGTFNADDLLGEIFGRFCIGK